jgi:hypothetical protein
MQAVEVDLPNRRLVSVPNECEAGWHLDVIALSQDYVGAVVMAGQSEAQLYDWTHS